MTGSVSIARAPASDEVTEERTDTDGDADGLIRMRVHGLVGGLGALDRLPFKATEDFLAVFQCGGEPLAGFANFFSDHIRGGGHQGARIFGKCAQVVC